MKDNKPKVGEVWIIRQDGYSFDYLLARVMEDLSYGWHCIILDKQPNWKDCKEFDELNKDCWYLHRDVEFIRRIKEAE